MANLSLSALAAQAGLAKSTLSQLEAGKGNPSVETMWAIATSLGIPVSALFEGASQERTLIRAQDGTAMRSEQSDYAVVLLNRGNADQRRDLFRVTLAAGAIRHSEPHPPGTVEHAVVCQGQIELGLPDEIVRLSVGDYFRFPGDVPHSYAAPEGPALLMLATDSRR